MTILDFIRKNHIAYQTLLDYIEGMDKKTKKQFGEIKRYLRDDGKATTSLSQAQQTFLATNMPALCTPPVPKGYESINGFAKSHGKSVYQLKQIIKHLPKEDKEKLGAIAEYRSAFGKITKHLSPDQKVILEKFI